MDDYGHLWNDAPLRDDGKKWTKRHLQAASQVAQGLSWVKIAENIGVKHKSAENYQRIPGWAKLVLHFQQGIFDAQIDWHKTEGAKLALEALKNQFTFHNTQVQALEEQLEGATCVFERASIERELYFTSKAVVSASKEYLKATGFTKQQETQATLNAKVAVQGDSAEHHKHTVEGGENPIKHTHAHTYTNEELLALARTMVQYAASDEEE